MSIWLSWVFLSLLGFSPCQTPSLQSTLILLDRRKDYENKGSQGSFSSVARLAQWKSTSFTRKGSQVQALQRVPFHSRCTLSRPSNSPPSNFEPCWKRV